MLSIRKVLEDNGIKIFTHDTGYTHISEININGSEEWYVSDYSDVDDKTIEQACRQYVKKNGFKLKWLNYNPSIEKYKYTNWLYQENIFSAKIDKNTNCIIEIFSDEKGTIWGKNKKLLAWLFANDIEIKEDKNEM